MERRIINMLNERITNIIKGRITSMLSGRITNMLCSVLSSEIKFLKSMHCKSEIINLLALAHQI